jgi:hypothetical protein
MIFVGGVFIPIQALLLQLFVVFYVTPLTYVMEFPDTRLTRGFDTCREQRLKLSLSIREVDT